MTEPSTPLASNEAREPETFKPYPPFPSLSPAQLDNWLSAVNIHAISAMEWRWPKHWVIASRTVNDSMFFWFKKGSGTAWFKNRTEVYHFKEGDMLLIPKDVEHEIESSNKEEAHVYACHFFATLFGGIDLLSMLGFPIYLPSRRVRPISRPQSVWARNAAVRAPGWGKADGVRDLQHPHPHPAHRDRVVYSVAQCRPSIGPSPPGAGSEVDRAEHLHTRLHRSRPCAPGLLERDTLSQAVSRSLRHQPRTVHSSAQNRARVLTAAFHSEPIKQIAADCGFAEEAFFSRVFHQALGKSPAAYRRAKML